MENSILFTNLSFYFIALFGGVLLALLFSWIFVTKYVAKKKTKDEAKKIGKIHAKVSIIIMIVFFIYTSIGIVPSMRDIISSTTFDLVPVMLSLAFFFSANQRIIKWRIFRVDMYGDKIDK